MIRAASALSIYRPGLFKDKVAIVTGGGTGIGKCIAHELASLGCKVVIGARNAERLEATAKEIRAQLGQKVPEDTVFPIACDIRKEDQVDNLIQTTLKKYQRIDFLVNNAGGQFMCPAENLSIKGLEAVVRTNLIGTFMLTQKAYKAYMKENGGSIVTIILLMEKGYPLLSHSGAARAGIENITKSLAVEWAQSGVRLNCVAPGIIMSSGVDNYDGGSEVFVTASKKVTTAKRVGTVEEVSAATLYYLSPASAYTTGTTMFVDGGWHLNGSLYDIPQHDKCPPYGTITPPSKTPQSKL